jgi:hypothetical protein
VARADARSVHDQERRGDDERLGDRLAPILERSVDLVHDQHRLKNDAKAVVGAQSLLVAFVAVHLAVYELVHCDPKTHERVVQSPELGRKMV